MWNRRDWETKQEWLDKIRGRKEGPYHTTLAAKERQREEIKEQMARYLAKGGKIR